MQCVYGGKEVIIFEGNLEINLPEKIDLELLKKTIIWESKLRISTSKIKFHNQNYKQSKKEFVHSLRYIFFSLQILKEKKISNFSIVNEIFFYVMQKKDFSDFSVFFSCFRFVLEKFKEIVKNYKNTKFVENLEQLALASLEILKGNHFHEKYEKKKKNKIKKKNFIKTLNGESEREKTALRIINKTKLVDLETKNFTKNFTKINFVNNFVENLEKSKTVQNFLENNKNISAIPHKINQKIILFTVTKNCKRKNYLEKFLKHIIIDFQTSTVISFFPKHKTLYKKISNQNLVYKRRV